MDFDTCEHRIRQLVIKAGREIRKAKGLPEEMNITTVFNETAPLLGIAPIQMTSSVADHLPAPHEMKTPQGGFAVPRKDCPQCGGSMVLSSICPSCKDSEGGKFKSGYKCMNKECELIDDKTDEFFTQRLIRMGIEVPMGLKQTIGIKTITDDGLK